MAIPTIDPSLTEKALPLLGWATVVLGLATLLVGASQVGADGPIPLAIIVGGSALFSALPLFAVAEVLGRLRRQEERELIREWESDGE